MPQHGDQGDAVHARMHAGSKPFPGSRASLCTTTSSPPRSACTSSAWATSRCGARRGMLACCHAAMLACLLQRAHGMPRSSAISAITLTSVCQPEPHKCKTLQAGLDEPHRYLCAHAPASARTPRLRAASVQCSLSLTPQACSGALCDLACPAMVVACMHACMQMKQSHRRPGVIRTSSETFLQ